MAEQHTPPDRDVLTFEAVRAAWDEHPGELQSAAALFGWVDPQPEEPQPPAVIDGGDVTWP